MTDPNMRARAEKLAFELVKGAPVGAGDGNTFYMRQPDPDRLTDALVSFATTIAAEATLKERERAKVLRQALEPFAAYADPQWRFPADMTVTSGSGVARRQLTMGDCYVAQSAIRSSSMEDGHG